MLKIMVIGKKTWIYNELALELGMSPSEVHAAAKRVLQANLVLKRADNLTLNVRNAEEFFVHGLKYVFVPEKGGIVRGMATGFSAPPLNKWIVQGDEPVPVWPDPDGKLRGLAYSPLYKSVPIAAKKDSKLYELLVLVDGIRGGSVREQKLAIKELKMRLEKYEKETKS